MNAEYLYRGAMNEKRTHDSIVFAVGHLRRAIDNLAELAAKTNAEWHDDPEAEDHADYHAPADVQFPRAVRDEAIRDLVAHYLVEMALSDEYKATHNG